MGPEAMLVGAAIFLLGAVFGRYWPSRRKGPKPPGPVEPVCGCGHHASFHDAGTGECHGGAPGHHVPVRDEHGGLARDGWGEVVFARESGRCECRRYTGPEPLPQYFAPGISGG